MTTEATGAVSSGGASKPGGTGSGGVTGNGAVIGSAAMSVPCTNVTMTSTVTTAVEADAIPVGAALCRDRAAKRPHNFNIDA